MHAQSCIYACIHYLNSLLILLRNDFGFLEAVIVLLALSLMGYSALLLLVSDNFDPSVISAFPPGEEAMPPLELDLDGVSGIDADCNTDSISSENAFRWPVSFPAAI